MSDESYAIETFGACLVKKRHPSSIEGQVITAYQDEGYYQWKRTKEHEVNLTRACDSCGARAAQATGAHPRAGRSSPSLRRQAELARPGSTRTKTTTYIESRH